jgi:hypothetical protein
MTPRDLAILCQQIYTPQPGQFDSVVDISDVCAGIKMIDGINVIAFRGSANITDWIHDLEALPGFIPMVGTVHTGMYCGIPEMFDNLSLRAGEEVVLTGHSLGGAHAAYIARLCLLRGIQVSRLYLFEPPRCGYQDLHDGLRNITELKAWRNGIDPVTDVPITLEDFPWVQFPLIHIVQPPGGWDDLDPVAWHSIKLVAQGV